MGVDIGRERARALMRWSDTSRFNPRRFPTGIHVTPELPYTRVESYPLGDWIYNRGRAISDMVRAELSWRFYLNRQPADTQEAILKVLHLFRN